MIYLDNAATSYPKPFEVINEVTKSLSVYGANPGRSGHTMSVNTAGAVYAVREKLDAFFNGFGSEFVSFTQNCTYALNTAIKGLAKKGDRILISDLEHNSVLRPVHKLKLDGIADYGIYKVGKTKNETLASLRNEFTDNTKIVVATAVSNVFGDILPLKEIGELAQKNCAKLIVDAAQGAGVIDIDMKRDNIDCLCAPAHKGLYGVMGAGFLMHNGLDIDTLTEGGSGAFSALYEQPEQYPERLESGTVNVPGIVALGKGVDYISQYGIGRIFDEESHLCDILFDGLCEIEGVRIYGDRRAQTLAPIVSFNINNLYAEQTAALLNEGGIAVRGGLHCAVLAHTARNSLECGTVRVSPSFSNTEKDIKILLNLVRKIAFCKQL